MSGAPIIRGTNQFPNPPIKIGITMKKIMINTGFHLHVYLDEYVSSIR